MSLSQTWVQLLSNPSRGNTWWKQPGNGVRPMCLHLGPDGVTPPGQSREAQPCRVDSSLWGSQMLPKTESIPPSIFFPVLSNKVFPSFCFPPPFWTDEVFWVCVGCARWKGLLIRGSCFSKLPRYTIMTEFPTEYWRKSSLCPGRSWKRETIAVRFRYLLWKRFSWTHGW